MPINIFSVVLLVVLLYQTTKKNRSSYIAFVFQLTLFMYLTCNIGYFVKIGNISIDYYRFLLYYLGLIVTVCNFRYGMKKKPFIYFIIMSFVITIGYAMGGIEQYKIVSRDGGGWDSYLFGGYHEETVSFGTTQVKMILDFISTIMIFLYVNKNFSLDVWNTSLNKVFKWIKYYLFYGIIEAFIVYGLHIYDLTAQINSLFFGFAESTFTTALARGDGFMLQGLFREPSQYARGLFLIFLLILFVENAKDKNKARWWLLLCVGLMLLSSSFTSLLLVFTLCILLILYKCKEKPKILPVVIGIGIVIIIIMLSLGVYLIQSDSYYGQRVQYSLMIITTLITIPDVTGLYSSLTGMVRDGSSILRIGSSYANLQLQLPKAWVFGIGLGNSCSFSYTSNLIVDLGLLGTFLYMKIFVFWKYKNIYYIVACIIYFTINLFVPITNTFGLNIIMLFFILGGLYGAQSCGKRIKVCQRTKNYGNNFTLT